MVASAQASAFAGPTENYCLFSIKQRKGGFHSFDNVTSQNEILILVKSLRWSFLIQSLLTDFMVLQLHDLELGFL